MIWESQFHQIMFRCLWNCGVAIVERGGLFISRSTHRAKLQAAGNELVKSQFITQRCQGCHADKLTQPNPTMHNGANNTLQ